uniref:Disease resistance protein RPM1 n=1 Tax=Oryza punctata TaxID=4537 RepID=A0A0E0MI94_ORYPU
MSEAIALAMSKIDTCLETGASFKNAMSKLSKKDKLVKELLDKIEQIKRQLDITNDFIQKQIGTVNLGDPLDESWIATVRRLAFIVEDVMEKYLYYGHQLQEEGSQKHPVKRSSYVDVFNKVAQVMDKINYRIGNLLSIREQSQLAPQRVPHSPYPDSEGEPELIGTNGPINALLKFLKHDEDEAVLQLKVLSMLGIGGIGKTALASKVYRMLQKEFQSHAFVTVSKMPDMKTVLSDISHQIGLRENPASLNENQVITQIGQYLKDKRYLIVIDDLWDMQHWKTIKDALPDVNCGSRLIVTTRLNNIAKTCSSRQHDLTYKVMPLAHQDSRTLFLKEILGHEGSCLDAPVFDEILKMFGGMPSALKSIGSFLRNKSVTTEFQKINMSSLHSELENFPSWKKLKKALFLSCCGPSQTLEACSLYLSTLPDNHKIERDILTRKWISEGIILKDNVLSINEVANNCFEELINRNVIQQVDNSFGEETYEIQFLMHHILRQIARERNFAIFFSDNISISCKEPIHRLSFHCSKLRISIDKGDIQIISDSGDSNQKPNNLSLARSITLCGYAKPVSFKLLEHLHVLDLEGCWNVDNSTLDDICRMILLQYLSLKKTRITVLPPQIENLRCLKTLAVTQTEIAELPLQIGKLPDLETLDVRHTQVKEIPKELVQLPKLVCLLFGQSGFHGGVKFPVGGNPSKSLKVLGAIDSTQCSASFMGELSSLTGLTELSVVCYDGTNYKEWNLRMMNSIFKFSNLESLTIYGDFILGNEVPALRNPPKLQKLKLAGRCLSVPGWIDKFSNVTLLDIRICSLEESDLKTLCKMSSLQRLVLTQVHMPIKQLKITKDAIFSQLNGFTFDCRVPWITFEKEAMPSLQYLELKLYAGPAGKIPSGITYLPSLTNIILRYSSHYKSSATVQDTISKMRKESNEHPNMIVLSQNGEHEIFPQNAVSQNGEHEIVPVNAVDGIRISYKDWYINLHRANGKLILILVPDFTRRRGGKESARKDQRQPDEQQSAMEHVVGASEATMRSLLTKLGGLLSQEYALIRGVRGDIQYIRDELTSMQAFIRDLSGAPEGKGDDHDHRIKDWMKQIRDVTYDIEDCIDDFAHRLSHDPGGDYLCGFVVSRVYEILTWWPRRDIASNIAELKMRAQQIGERRTRYGVENPQKRENKSGPATIGFDAAENQHTNLELVGVRELVGVEAYMEELTKWVTNKTYEDGVLSVLGFGGVGKTTIATALYRQLGDQFDRRAMVTVSQSSDVEAILRSILEQVMPQSKDGQEQQGGHASQKKRLHQAVISYLDPLMPKALRRRCLAGGSNSMREGKLLTRLPRAFTLDRQYDHDPQPQDGNDAAAGSSETVVTTATEGGKLQGHSTATSDEIKPSVIATIRGAFMPWDRHRRPPQDDKAGSTSGSGKESINIQTTKPGEKNIQTMKRDGLSKLLEEHLNEKRYFLLIDDVWSATTWEQIRKHLPTNNQSYRIIVTTRFQAVATACKRKESDRIHKVDVLRGEKSEKLFNEVESESKISKEGEQKERDGEQKAEIVRPPRIWEMCSGLPLAIVTMAGHVACNSDKDEKHWLDVCKSLVPESGRDLTQEGVTRILGHCYNDMPAELRTCSLYLSIFPKGSKISRKRLTKRWIAEGFVSEKQGLSVEDVAEACFNHLVRRKIIRPVEHSSNGKVKNCQVHDMVLEYIVSKASEENFVTVVGGYWLMPPPSSKVRRLSLQSGDSKRGSGTDSMNLSHVRSLTMFGSLSQLPSNSFKFGIVQVLDLQGCKGFKQHHTKELFNMLLIKYLSLRRTDINKLPKKIGKLKYLETLDIRETNVTKLPRSVCQLERVANILGGNKRTRKALKLPAEDVKKTIKSLWGKKATKESGGKKTMKTLRILSGIEIVGESTAEGDFHHLTDLRKLAIYKLNVRRGDKPFENLISSIEYLGGYSLHTLVIDDVSSEFLESLGDLSSPPKFLKSLELSGKLVELPKWITQLEELTKLTLSVTVLRTDNLRSISQLKKLFSLTFSLSGSKPDPQSTAILEENKNHSDGEILVPAGGFENLKLLRFSAPLLPLLSFQENAMPSLERLELRFRILEGLFGIQNLKRLKEVHLRVNYRAGEVTKSIVQNVATQVKKEATKSVATEANKENVASAANKEGTELIIENVTLEANKEIEATAAMKEATTSIVENVATEGNKENATTDTNKENVAIAEKKEIKGPIIIVDQYYD